MINKTFKYFLFALFIGLSLQAQTLTDSNLPIIIINTDINPETGQATEINDDYKVLASMKLLCRPDGSRNFITDENNPDFLNYDGRIAIEIRGSSSQSLDKKPYGLKTLQNNNTTSNNVSILNMPAENDWVLNALPFDSSLIRDYLSYNLAREIGNYATRTNYCEVIINGDYKGLYIFMEKLKIDSNRINILKLTNEDNSLPNVSGGYVTKCDKTTGNDPIAWGFETSIFNYVDFIHDSPKPENITPAQNDYIYSEFYTLENTMINQNASIIDGFPSMIDVPSFVDFIILNELASNVDGYQLSTYFHKDRNGKLRAGPIWDFNLAYGLDVFGDRSQTNVWQFDNGDNVGAKFWKNLFDNPIFKCYLVKRWNELTSINKPLNYNSIVTKINSYVALLSEASVRENNRWGTVNDFTSSSNEIKTWLQTRTDWIDANIGTNTNCIFPDLPLVVISKINYNPIPVGINSGNDLEFIEITNNSDVAVDLSGYYFRELGITYSFPINSILTANDKLYLASNFNSFTTTYGFAPFGVFTRNLSNKSQKLSLVDPFGNSVDFVDYQDSIPWPIEADGTGSYLSLIDLNSNNSLAESWISSSQILKNPSFTIENTTTIYPNPIENVFYVSNSTSKIIGYELFDNLGRIIQSKIGIYTNSIAINSENLATQNYILKIILEKEIIVYRKIIKSN